MREIFLCNTEDKNSREFQKQCRKSYLDKQAFQNKRYLQTNNNTNIKNRKSFVKTFVWCTEATQRQW